MFNRNLATAALQTFGVPPQAPRSPATRIVESLRTGLREFFAWRNRCRERKELYEFLAAIIALRRISDIGIGSRDRLIWLQLSARPPESGNPAEIDGARSTGFPLTRE